MGPLLPTSSIDDFIDAARDTAIELQRLLTAVPALGPQNEGTGEWPKATALCKFLAGLGFPAPVFMNAPDPAVPEGSRPNVAFILPGTPVENRPAAPTRWFISHLDVVPPGEGWTGDPYTLRIDGDCLIGRGTLDNQQGIVSSVVAFHALMNAGVPHFPIGLLFVSDEETGSAFGVQHVLDVHELIHADDLVIVPDAGNAQSTMIEVAEKSVLWLKITTRGRQCHASHPAAGMNALLAAARLITRLDGLHAEFPQADGLFDPPFSTFEPTKKPGNGIENVNTIPGHDTFYLDCRLSPVVDPDAVRAAIDRHARAVEHEMAGEARYADVPLTIAVEVVSLERAAPVTPPDSPVVRALVAAIRDVYHAAGTPMGMGGGTVAALVRRKGIPAAVWATMHGVAHQPDEYSHISFTLGDAKVFAHLCVNRV